MESKGGVHWDDSVCLGVHTDS